MLATFIGWLSLKVVKIKKKNKKWNKINERILLICNQF